MLKEGTWEKGEKGKERKDRNGKREKKREQEKEGKDQVILSPDMLNIVIVN
jgi:hypothetical protein